MRIAMLVANPITYDGRVIRHAATLAEAGHEVIVLGVIGPNDRDTPAPAAGFSHRRLDRRRSGVLPRLVWAESALRQRAASRLAGLLPGPWLDRLPGVAELAVATSAPELAALALRSGAAAIHGNDLNTLPAAAWAGRLSRRPYIYDAHELYVDERPDLPELERRCRRAAEGRLCRGAAAVLTVNELIAEELQRMYGVPAPVVVRNLPPLGPGPRLDQAGAPGTLRLLYHGANLGLEQEGTDDILRAMARLRGRADVRLTLRGGLGEAERQRLQARIAELGLTDQITIFPPVPGAAALVAAAVAGGEEIGLAVHPGTCGSYRYTTSSKVFEYQAAGLAVCATDLAGNRLSADERAAAFYPPGDDAALAELLHGLAHDRPRLLAMRRAARARAASELCWERERQRLLAIYDRLDLSSPPGNPPRRA